MPSFELMSALVVTGIAFSLDYGQETSGQAGGQVRVKDLRSPIWRMKVDCSALTVDRLRRVRAIVGGLGGSMGSFYAWDPGAQFPEADPEGALLGTADVQIAALGPTAGGLTLRGLPGGYVISTGDMLSFDFGIGRRALHQVVAGTVASGAGMASELIVHPPLRQGATINTSVALKRPSGEFRILPGSLNLSAEGMAAKVGFDAVQVV